jgi:hypothetical protein
MADDDTHEPGEHAAVVHPRAAGLVQVEVKRRPEAEPASLGKRRNYQRLWR